MMWDVWWAWVAAGICLAILEVFVPGFVFLGFAVGAVVVGILLALGGAIAAWLTSSVSMMALMFAIFSLVAWLVLRKVMGVRKGQIRHWETDINED
ncbi:NfeD family protein [Marimonas lutisalis]|uniref:NfeD family protein n=1 Tax=Marimonas lutisalis TaxID=2545756 RepID=UPI002E256A13